MQQSESVVRRQPNAPAGGTATPAPPAPAAPAQPAPPVPDEAAQKALLEDEKAAFGKAQARQGQPAVTALYSDPGSSTAREKPPEEETFTTAEVVDRNSGTPLRKGFDAPGPAAAYAGLIGGDTGAVVLQQDKFSFAAKLAKGKHKMRATAPTITQGDWWTFTSYIVYRVTPAAGVVSVIGVGGYQFPPNVTLTVDPSVARLGPQPATAAPADAESLRQIAGVAPLGPAGAGAPSPGANQVPIPEAQQEAFILGYFRSRGLEALAANSTEVDRLAKDFAPTVKETGSTPAHGVSDEARAMIAAEREESKLYARLLDQEVKVAALLDYLSVCQERGEFPPFYPLYHKDQKAQVEEMVKKIQRVQSDVKKRQFDILSRSPLIGQLVGLPDPKDRFNSTQRIHGYLVETPDYPKLYGKNPVDESPLAAPSSPESDETIRASFLTKLDAVRKAIRDARSEMYGDADFLLGFEGLQELVTADFSSIAGANAGLKEKLKKMLASHAKSEKAIEIGGTVIQFALLLIPGGAFLSAAVGMGMAVRKMDQGLRRWTVSQASVNPAAALVDRQKAEAQLTQTTIDLAVNAVFIATEAINGLKALEAGGRDKKLAEAFEKLEKNEAEQATVKEAASGGHAVEVTAQGIELCSNRPCPLLKIEFAAELEQDTARGGTLKKELEDAEALRATNPKGAAEAGRRIEARLMEQRLGVVLRSTAHDAPALLSAARISEVTGKLTADFPFLAQLSPGAVERIGARGLCEGGGRRAPAGEVLAIRRPRPAPRGGRRRTDPEPALQDLHRPALHRGEPGPDPGRRAALRRDHRHPVRRPAPARHGRGIEGRQLRGRGPGGEPGRPETRKHRRHHPGPVRGQSVEQHRPARADRFDRPGALQGDRRNPRGRHGRRGRPSRRGTRGPGRRDREAPQGGRRPSPRPAEARGRTGHPRRRAVLRGRDRGRFAR